ncbi:GRIP and coiled-coil domain-containing protein 2-like [Uloborus diversus]|uniref:GRIP and coiled-coil domain-containing protein 2-like n=1 Tax=Uloborus diversus TaxID=327109 RepID=UPI00240A494B|nr:GRIP and coiled-coil domain-containing protein 2-like [Uloborus diversus]
MSERLQCSLNVSKGSCDNGLPEGQEKTELWKKCDSDDVSVLKEQLKVAYENIGFLKSEQTLTLKGLHNEIEHLQNLCRNLQFKCEAEGCILPNNDFFKCTPKVLEHKVNTLVQENADLKRKLADSHQAIDILDQKEKLALWQHHQELEQRDNMIIRLEKELEEKCSILAQLNSHGVRKKKGNFWRRFSFNSSNHPSTSNAVPHSKIQQPRVEHLSKEDLPTEIQNSLPSHESQYQSYSSYSSLSAKSVSDDEGFAQRCFTDKQSDERECEKDKGLAVKLPPISNLPLVSSHQLVRHQLRIHSLANKVRSDSLAIDQMRSPEVAMKRLSKA